jgi:site-specific DNA recombinase
MGKVFAYARVSTSRQGEKGVSLQEQSAAITRYADQHGLEITRWFEERETAAKAGRGEFMELLRLLRLKVADGVIIHKIDRGARNLEDWTDLGKLVDAGADIYFATENLDLKTVAGRLSADIQAVVAAHYSRNLREETKKGFYGRLKQGFYPLRAPIGYIDQGAARPKAFDSIRAPLVRQAFGLYAAGTHSLPSLVVEMFRHGLRNRGGGPVSLNGMATMLKNPFYIGLMKIRRTGEIFRGNHEPLIPNDVFERVQAVLAGKRVDRAKSRAFAYSRLVRCANCGYSLIAERQKGHTYYRCHNRPFKKPAVCPPTSVREERLDGTIIAALEEVELTDKELQVARALIQQKRNNEGSERVAAEQSLQLQSQQIDNRLSKLADLLIEGAVTRSVYQIKQEALLSEQAAVKRNLQDIHGGGESALAQFEKTVELAKSPSLLYKTAHLEHKRELLKILLSNLAVSSKNVEITLAQPFRLIAERKENAKCSPNRGTCRTWEQTIQELYEYLTTHSAALPGSI